MVTTRPKNPTGLYPVPKKFRKSANFLARPIGAVEALAQARDVSLRNALARVGDRDRRGMPA
jgi:hypothetical protein